jgi:DNA-binding NtrC family response regulator
MNPDDFFVARAPASRAIRDQAVQLAGSGLPVLIVGPEGSGRRRLAELIHRLSPRQGAPLLSLDCLTVTDDSWPGRLYGHAATAAPQGAPARAGLVERAAGGALIFESLHAAPAELVRALRRLLDGGRVGRLGDEEETLGLSCRVLATAAAGDGLTSLTILFSRRLELQPLSRRPEDIPDLVRHLLARCGDELGKRLTPPDEGLMEHLSRLHWDDGEVQQLERALRYAIMAAATDGQFREELLPDWVLGQLSRSVVPRATPVPAADDLGLPCSDQLSRLIEETTLGLLGVDSPPPAFALRCRNADFRAPVIREVIQGTLDACRRHLLRNIRDVKAGAKPLFRHLPPVADRTTSANPDELADHFRSALEEMIQSIRGLPEDAGEEVLVEIASPAPERRKPPVASMEEVQDAYDRVVSVLQRTGTRKIPGRDRMVTLLEKDLRKKVPPTYVTNARKARGHDRRREKAPRKVGLEIGLEREAQERLARERQEGTDAQSQVDREIDCQAEFERMDDGELNFTASKMRIRFEAGQEREDRIQLLIQARRIWDFIDGHDDVKTLAKNLEIAKAGLSREELGNLIFDKLWQQHLTTKR